MTFNHAKCGSQVVFTVDTVYAQYKGIKRTPEHIYQGNTKPGNSNMDVSMKTENLAFCHPINVYGKKANFCDFFKSTMAF